MVFELRSEFHEDLLRTDRVAQLLDYLLNFVVEFGLGSDDVETIDQLRHDFSRIVAIFG